MVCSQKSVRNRNFFENAGHVSFCFCQTGSAETHTKPCKTSPQGTSIKRPAIYWDHAVSWGGGVWVSVSDIGRVGKKMVLHRIPIYFLSTIFHDLKPKLASEEHNNRNSSEGHVSTHVSKHAMQTRLLIARCLVRMLSLIRKHHRLSCMFTNNTGSKKAPAYNIIGNLVRRLLYHYIFKVQK